jgi:hypothetical protein
MGEVERCMVNKKTYMEGARKEGVEVDHQMEH